MKARPIIHRASGFTLLETVIVVAVIALLAALVLSINIDPPNKRRPTEAMMPAIESCLERYHEQFGEFPQPANQDETAELMPGKVYRIGAAKCLYQALTGDGTDAIQGAGDDAKTSDGVLDDEDTKRMIFKDMPAKMRRKVGNSFILVDGYGRPFQYIKADPEKKNTVNSTYDLWSYGDDETNLRATSKDAEANPAVGAKWIKNW